MRTHISVAHTVPLYLGFAATGIGVALPGAVLPALLIRWHLQDEQAGRLFLLGWIGSSAGALLTRGKLGTALGLGSLAVALACGGLAATHGAGVDVLMLLYGIGLGLVMTATTLVRQAQMSGDAAGTAREMLRLNLAWAVGAVTCPSLTARALAGGSLLGIFLPLSLCFLLLGVWAVSVLPAMPLQAEGRRRPSFVTLFGEVPLPLIAMTFLITGIEASAGGWLSTYAARGGLRLGAVVEAPTCLWAGLLISRLFWSAFARRMAETTIVRGSVLLMVAAALMLIQRTVTEHGGLALLAASFLLGCGIGPIYPLLLAWVSRFHRGGEIFFLAGVGSAALPWLTGLLSQERQSLRSGLVAPLSGALIMLLLALGTPLRRWAAEQLEDS